MPFEVTKTGEQPSGKFEVTKLSSGESAAEEPEGWGSYLGRNIAKTPALAYELGRTGLGLGNLLEMALSEQPAAASETDPNKAIYDYLANYRAGATTGLKSFLPSSVQANKEISQILPEYMTQHRPGDWPAEYALTELPLIAATGGMKSIPAFGKSALQSLGILGGSELGGLAGQAFGEELGMPNLGRVAGAIGGGHLGGLGARAIMPGRSNILPTKKMAPEKLIEDLKEQQKINYDTAISLEGNKRGNATGLIDTINEVDKDLGKGMAKTDQDHLRFIIKSIDDTIANGTLTLADAKTIKRNINDQLYEHTVTNPVKKQLTKIVGGLNDFITENGSPEHNKVWQQAEQTTRDIKKFENQIRHAKEAKESLPGIIKEGMKRFGLPAGLGSLAKYFGFSPIVSAVTGFLTKGAQRLFVEGKYLYRISQEHPAIYSKYMDTLAHAAKMDAAKVAIRINDIAKSLDKYYPEEESQEAI